MSRSYGCYQYTAFPPYAQDIYDSGRSQQVQIQQCMPIENWIPLKLHSGTGLHIGYCIHSNFPGLPLFALKS